MTQGLVVALAVLLILFVLLNWRRKKSVPEAPYVSKRIPELSRWEPEVPHVPKQIGPVRPVSWWDATKYGVGSGVLLGGAGWAYLLWLENERKRQWEKYLEEEIPKRPEQVAQFKRNREELIANW